MEQTLDQQSQPARYQSPLVEGIYNLWRQWDEEIAKAGGMIYKMTRGEIPLMLDILDTKPALREGVRRFLASIPELIPLDAPPEGFTAEILADSAAYIGLVGELPEEPEVPPEEATLPEDGEIVVEG